MRFTDAPETRATVVSGRTHDETVTHRHSDTFLCCHFTDETVRVSCHWDMFVTDSLPKGQEFGSFNCENDDDVDAHFKRPVELLRRNWTGIDIVKPIIVAGDRIVNDLCLNSLHFQIIQNILMSKQFGRLVEFRERPLRICEALVSEKNPRQLV